MNTNSKVIVFSENRDTRGAYISFGNLYELTPIIKEKNKVSLQVLMEQKYDLVLIEIMNPVMSEIEYVDQVYALAQGAPIILISSYFFDTKDIVFGSKIQGFIMKPVDLNKIKAAVDSLEASESVQNIAQSLPVNHPEKVDRVMQENKKLSVLLEISHSLNSINNFDDLLSHIISLAIGALQAERATLFIADWNRGELWSRSGTGLEKQEIRIPIDTGIAGEVAGSGKPQIIHDPYNHPKFNKDVDLKTGFKTRNILCLPMINLEGKVIGVFQILNKLDGEFNNDDLSFLNAMAVSTGIAIENVLLHDELKKQLAEIKQSYDDLYIAQNAILKDTRFVTFNEIHSYILEVLKKIVKVEEASIQVKNSASFDEKCRQFADAVSRALNVIRTEASTYLEEKKKEFTLKG